MRLKEHCANFTPPAAPYKTAKIKTTFKNVSAIENKPFLNSHQWSKQCNKRRDTPTMQKLLQSTSKEPMNGLCIVSAHQAEIGPIILNYTYYL